MTPIRPPGSTAAPFPVEGASSVGAPSPVAPSAVVAPAKAQGATPANSVIADLQAGRITPDAAVQRLTEIAIEGARCPAAMRPAVEARIRATLATDPLLGSLLRRVGASAPDE